MTSPNPHRQRQMRRFRRILGAYFGRLDDQLVTDILAASQWQELEGGEILFKQGAAGDAAYFLIAGRLSAIRTDAEGNRIVLGDVRPGETVGEEAVLSAGQRGALVQADRDSVVVKLSNDYLHHLFIQYPQLLLKTAQLIIQRSRQSHLHHRPKRLSNLAVIPLSPHCDLVAFQKDFAEALKPLGRVRFIQAHEINALLGESGIAEAGRDQPERYRQLSAWLDAQEGRFDHIVYLADAKLTAWTQRCLRQADSILLLADAEEDAQPQDFEQQLMTSMRGCHNDHTRLVLWHPSTTVLPQGTKRWLAPRPWVSEAIHVRRHDSRHMARLARIATGHAIGLVLGSGGARGLAAIGILKALTEAAIPIDRVGGTSIGSIMAASTALDRSFTEMSQHVQRAFQQNPTHWQDLSPLPILSIYRGQHLNRLLQAAFPPRLDIEDLWINFFCITSNMSHNREDIQRSGTLWKALRASASLPGIFPPVALQGHLQVDGAYLNALPVDVMESLGVHQVIAADFSWQPPSSDNFAEEPDLLRYLKHRFMDKTKPSPPIPGLLASLIQSSLLASSQRNETARANADILFSPNLLKVGLLEWERFSELVEAGYQHAKEVLSKGVLSKRQHTG
jgi:NTE family protein